jgi:flagellar motor switch protein FliN/FliY
MSITSEPMMEDFAPTAEPPEAVLEPKALMDVGVRVWAEIGRTRMPVADAVALAHGSVVHLDRLHDEPVDLYVNGLHYATGRLVVVDGEWALTIDTVDASDEDVERMSSEH